MIKKYPLLGLKTIRDRRLQDSMNERISKYKLYEQAQKEAQARRKEYEDYKLWKTEEVERRYSSLMNTTHSLDQIQKFNSGIKQLHMKEFELEEEIKKAENSAVKAHEIYKKAVQTEMLNRKKLQKLETHQEIWETAERKYEEMQADQELEDFIPRSRDF